jgi:murein DD-endopeptidase MepM/ murein hydrolase activator NlpD
MVTPTIAPSAALKIKPSLRAFSRKDFRSDERITVTVDNGFADETDIAVFDSNGVGVDVGRATISISDPLVYKLSLPREFRPGRFRLKVTTSDGQVSMQDFTWGVLALNPNKSIYRPQETARLSMAVLDEAGGMVCNALLTLEITDPDGKTTVVTTEDKTIIVNPECQVKGYVAKPDYESTYMVNGIGGYTMRLHATTKNGQYSIIDGFEVRDAVAFDVERVSNTRLFPPVTYPMEISVTAAEDFSGTIEEVVPGHVAINKLDGVVAFDSLSMETVSTASAQKEANIPVLSMPTDRLHPISLTFGDQLRDPLVKQKYADFGLLGHDGIDFDMPEGTAVLAVDDGVVVKADTNGDYGGTIVLQHSWGRSYYGHLSVITAQLGEKRGRGLPIGVSGSTGLSTGPHLHFGIKPNVNDPDNGYYGKINPFAYLSFKDSTETFGKDVAGVATPSAELVYGGDVSVQKITWRVNFAKGQTTKIGYTYQVPNISPQFYLMGPLTMRRSDGTEVFQSTRPWQLAADASGSGANSVNPTTGTTSATGNTYTFTFDPSEAMDSGGMTITVPSSGSPDWSAPQGTGGTAGYTTAVGTGTATVGNVLNNADVEDPTDPAGIWQEIDMDMCGVYNSLNAAGDILVDTSVKQEGTGSIVCKTTTGVAAAADNNDDWGFVYDTNQNWNTFCNGAKCGQIGYWIRAAVNTEAFEFDVSSTTDISTGLAGAMCAGSITTANTWEYKTCDISAATLTTVKAFGFSCTNNTCNPFDGGDVWVDEFLIGPGVPTFSGRVATVRFVDLAAADTVTVTYGDTGGGAGSTVTNSSTAGAHTFTTASMLAAGGSYVDLAGGSPAITLSSSGPTTDQQMRHGAWFSAGVEQPFTF